MKLQIFKPKSESVIEFLAEETSVDNKANAIATIAFIIFCPLAMMGLRIQTGAGKKTNRIERRRTEPVQDSSRNVTIAWY